MEKTYLLELQSLRKAGKDLALKELSSKKISQPLTLGESLDKQVQAYLKALGRVGGVVNRAIAIASARGIVRKKIVQCLLKIC